MRGENNLKVYYLALSLFLTFFFAHQITHVMCFGRYRDKKCKKKKFYFIYGFWVVFFGILCTMMGSASGVDHTFDYGMNSLELYLGKKNYFEGNVIYAEDDYKHNGDFILEYYVKNTEDIEIISKQIVEENVFIFRAYNLNQSHNSINELGVLSNTICVPVKLIYFSKFCILCSMVSIYHTKYCSACFFFISSNGIRSNGGVIPLYCIHVTSYKY